MKWIAFVPLAFLAACGSSGATNAPAGETPPPGGAHDASTPTPPGDDTTDGGSSDLDATSSGGDDARSSAPCTGLTAQPRDAVWSIGADAAARPFRVHVPASYDPTKPMPVVLDFHGYSSNGAQEDFLDHMTAKGDKSGFIVVQPDGLTNSWNAGACCGQSAKDQVDDVGFVNAILDMLEAKLCVDAARVFATGMSNGGFFSHRLGCELASRIAAIAPVAGILGIPTCTPSRPMPVIDFHGTGDTVVPYQGDAQNGWPSAPDTFAAWAKRDGCTGDPVETYRKADSHCATYNACASGVEVTLCTVDNGGHTWPGGTPIPTGFTTTNLSATDAMWTFFQAHPMK